ncbi:MAG: S9 family peptidase [Bacteroidales bacterium]|jgi:dipeptidyl-peptidase-4|nr:S9 family peptidase [Bacteroidales bacterium]
MYKKITLFFFIAVLLSVSVFSQNQTITVEKIWKDYLFSPRGVRGFHSMHHGDFYSVTSKNGIDKYSFETGNLVGNIITNDDLLLMSSQKVGMKDITSYEFDENEKQILIATDENAIFRRSSSAIYYIINLETKKITLLDDPNKGKQSFATFSHDGQKVAFVRDNNLFVKELNSGKVIQLTADGAENKIKNGFADWVYEEELSLTQAFEWAPDDSKIAFMRFDESKVKEFSMTMFGELYPETFSYKYPKAGEDNSVVAIYIYDFNTDKKNKIDFGTDLDCYFPRIYWLSNSTDLIILQLNRHQNVLDFHRYNTVTNHKDIVFTEQNSRWVEIGNIYFLDDNKSMLITSARDGWNHIYKVEFGGKTTQLTKGAYEVSEICAIDKKKSLIYYLSNETETLNRDLYVMNFQGKKKTLLTDGKGWNRITFSAANNFYLKNYSNATTPPYYTVCNSTGKELRVLQDNVDFVKNTQEYGFVPKEMIKIPTDNGLKLNGWMLRPSTFTEVQQYPVLMYVYGGPGSQEVNNSWVRSLDFAWYQMLVSYGYIVVCVDGRGTSGRGDEFKKCIYKQMGHFEAEDQLAVARYLQTLPYVDGNRIGIWGWSFGGYLSSLAMFKGEGLFKMAIAVAPVTNWRYYDNIYTERFLQTPQENPSGYDDNSPIFHTDKLQGAYLLVHGTADDNVHFQNSVDLTTALINSNKQFQEFFYPNMNHFINVGNARTHLYNKMTKFILDNL